MGSPSVRGVLFDVGGVLLLPDGEVVSAALTTAEITHEPRHREAHYVGVRSFDEVAGSDDDRDAYFDGYARALRVDDPGQAVAVLRTVWDSPGSGLWRVVVASAVDGLRAVAAAGLRLGIVSNSDGTVEEQLRSGAICQLGEGPGVPVAVIVDSALAEVAKPSPAIFNLALRGLDLEPDEVAFVGDSVVNDVEAAMAVGLRGIHFDPLGLCAAADHPHIDSVYDVVGLLAAGR